MQGGVGVQGGVGDPVEVAASRAAGIAEVALDDGARVMLCTVESAAPVVAEVADLLDVRRRLALAVAGTPSSPPDDWPVVRVAATSSIAAPRSAAPSARIPTPSRSVHPESETEFGGAGVGGAGVGGAGDWSSGDWSSGDAAEAES